jgi:putative transposase
VAFVVDVYARHIVGWRVSGTAHATFVMDALEQAIHNRRPVHRGGPLHHSVRGSQGVFNRSLQHLNDGGVYGTTGGVDEEVDWARSNALARYAVASV